MIEGNDMFAYLTIYTSVNTQQGKKKDILFWKEKKYKKCALFRFKFIFGQNCFISLYHV
jgi:hypothetical protein